jgi:GNAT superfamily N-acetyltransferase
MMATIGRASARDASGIARVYVDSWRSAYAGLVPDDVLLAMSYERQAAEWQRVIRCHPDNIVMIASEPDHGVVGMISCGPGRSGERPTGGPYAADARGGVPGEVFTLYVQPEFHGQGIGRQLLAAAFQAMRESGLERALIWVLSGNPGRYFYEAMGGTVIAERTACLWRTQLAQTAYGWPDLERAIARLGSCSAR